MKQLAMNVLTLKARNGTVPTNEEELVTLLGKPLPHTSWNTQVSYAFTNGGFFIRAHSPPPQFLILEFDSRRADAGVVAYPF